MGEQVLLSSKNLPLRVVGTKSLLPRWVGPFRVLHKVSSVAYRIELPPTWKVHKVFHISLLRSYRPGGRVNPPPPPELIDGELEHPVEAILSHRSVKRGRSSTLQYLIKWEGLGQEHNTWEPEANLTNCQEALQLYRTLLARQAAGRRLPSPAIPVVTPGPARGRPPVSVSPSVRSTLPEQVIPTSGFTPVTRKRARLGLT